VLVIVCHCGVVNDRAVVNAIQDGARTLAGVCKSTGAGQNCGTCVFSIRRLLCEHEPTIAPSLQEVEVAAS
jgi:bacterioferritin-associated ferredoxin